MTEKLTHRVAQCNATAELMGADMAIIPGITLRCELEAGHDVDSREHPLGGLIHEVDYPESMREWQRRTLSTADDDGWRIVPGTDHAFTFRWHDVTTDELAEVLDPDESFDLEVDIADEAVLEQQQQAAIDNGEPVDERDYHQCPTCRGLVCTCSDAVPEAAPRCLVCGREVRIVGVDDEQRHYEHVRIPGAIAPDHRAAVHVVNRDL